VSHPDDLTDLLNQARGGDSGAGDRAFASVYGHLKALAQTVLGRGGAQTLSATAMVHETYLRLMPGQTATVNDRRHFFRLAAKAMRQVLVDHARQRQTEKRGGDQVRTELSEALAAPDDGRHDLLAIDQALRALEQLDPQLVTLTEQHFFAGLTFEEIAAEFGVSDRSVRRDWDTARAFLLRFLADRPGSA
jgi:RNA polymerase sigma factor (TIGR02999 family)